MRKYILGLSVVLFATLIWAACDRGRAVDANKPSTNLEYLSFTDHGCRGQDVFGKANSSTPYLVKYQVSGDTLTLTIHHNANCCPAFVDSISVHENTVDVSIDDTLNGCKCMCEYENDFAFLYPGTGPLRVRFGWMGSSFELDTVIVIP